MTLSLPWTSYVDLVRTRAESQPDRLAVSSLPTLTDVTDTCSWASLDRRARAIAAALQADGAAGEPVVLLVENDAWGLASFLACAFAGAVAVPMPPLAHARHLGRLARVMRDCGATRVVASRVLKTRCEEALASLGERPALRWTVLDEVSESHADRWEDHYPRPDAVAFLQYTSGSTSAPKGVVVRHADLIWQGESLAPSMGFVPEDRGLTWMPLFHDLGLIIGALQPLYSGFPLWLTSPAAAVKAPDRWLKAISDRRITASGGPNFCYDLCVDQVDPATIPGLDLSCWVSALNAAEPVRAGTIDRFVAKFGPYGFDPRAMQPGYGLAEATVGVAVTRRLAPYARRRVDPAALDAGRVVDSDAPDARTVLSSGQPLHTLTVAIVDPATGLACPADVVGEIWSSCDHFPERYWGMDGAAAFDARLDGRRFVRTGDLGFLDGAGNLTITGRIKDLIVVAGKNHYPQDIELTVEEAHPAVRRNFVAAFAVERDGAEGVVVVAEVTDTRALGEARTAITKAVAERNELALQGLLLVAPGQVPKTTSGKIQRSTCRERWATETFQVAS